MVFFLFYILFYIKNYKILELIACSPEIVPFFKISKGIKQRNITSLLIFSRVLINANNYLEAAF